MPPVLINDCGTSTEPRYFAHTLPPPRTRADWESLSTHLESVAQKAAEFAGAFGAAEWGWVLGRCHDLGKYSKEFQQYLISSADPDAGEEGQSQGRVDHSTFGARYVAKAVGGHAGQVLAFCIAGHHAGLPNAVAMEASAERSTLRYRLDEACYRPPSIGFLLDGVNPPPLRLPFKPIRANIGFQIAFFTRMIFSALIDADRLATEAFCDPIQSAERSVRKPSIGELFAELDGYLRQKQSTADQTDVNRTRARVLADCIAATSSVPGFFSLNVPTGGGKTFSSLAFALRHAMTHGLRRMIVAVPFTTIIEQTADEYRKALGPLAECGLVEHHSNITPARDTRQNKLATENWDAPLIVTTNVQLYESLFASATTPCRKLHRLAQSVIVLDEAQTIPVELLHPTLLALHELVNHYGCTVVLCTATQPALEQREGFGIGIDEGSVRPIVRNATEIFAALKRVQVIQLGKQTDNTLVERLASEPTALCVVNTRRHASKLYDALVARCGRDTCFHLSTFMCAQHRREALATIRERLRDAQACRLVSTQLIEAGVDIDFPTVYRAQAGFDSIAQAAGRCNREGSLPTGRVYLFDAETLPPPGLLRHAAQTGHELAAEFDDPLTPEAIETYFRLFYWSQEHQWDRHEVLAQFDDDLRGPRLRLQFREGASRYKIIREEQVPVLVPYDEQARGIHGHLLRGGSADFKLLRATHRYIVSVWENLLNVLEKKNLVLAHDSGLWLLTNEAAYSRHKGLCLDAVGVDPELLIG